MERQGFYARRLLPRLIDLVMKGREFEKHRRGLLPLARGRVLEIGVGSGLNLPLYDEKVTRLVGLDPSAELLAMAARQAARARFPIELVMASAEDVPLAPASVDTVVSTFTLCSIPNAVRALEEARRVLVPGGRLLFVEHGLAPDSGVRRWQHRLTPMWRPLSGGCHLDRGIDVLVAQAGFRMESLEAGYAKGPRVASYVYRGIASP